MKKEIRKLKLVCIFVNQPKFPMSDLDIYNLLKCL